MTNFAVFKIIILSKMRKLLIPVLMLLAVSGATAQNNTVPGKTDIVQQEYLKPEEVPNSLYILPQYPDFNSVEFLNDQFQYYKGKSLRNTERGAKAITDATLDGLYGMNNAFGEVFGTEITLENTPEIFTLVRSIGRDAGGIAPKKAKNYYNRPRPFVFFNDHTSTPEKEDHMRDSGSYPSGHTCYGFAAALILAEINPVFSPIQLIFFFNSISHFLPFPVGTGEAEVAGGGAAVRTGEHPDAGFKGVGDIVV